MPERNRVTPTGEIVALDQRGLFLGNRGSIHRGHAIVRPWQVRRWITCVLSYKGWSAPMWEKGRWTPLFFWDEAVALAAGHRPCALCRHADHVRWLDGWEAAFGDRPRVDPMDRRLHDARVDGGEPGDERTVGTYVRADTLDDPRAQALVTAMAEVAGRLHARIEVQHDERIVGTLEPDGSPSATFNAR